jgi:hypothetical protein
MRLVSHVALFPRYRSLFLFSFAFLSLFWGVPFVVREEMGRLACTRMWTVDGSGSVSLGLVSLRLVHIALLNVGLVCGVCGLRAQGNGGGRRETRRCARTRRGYSRRCWRWMYLHLCIPGGEDLVCARPFRRLLSRRCEYGNTGGWDGGARCSPAPLPCPLPCSLLSCYRHAAQDLARTMTPGAGCVLVMGRPLVWMWGRPARGGVRLESGRRT